MPILKQVNPTRFLEQHDAIITLLEILPQGEVALETIGEFFYSLTDKFWVNLKLS